MNEVNIIETNSNKKYKKTCSKKLQTQQSDFGRQTYITIHKPYLRIKQEPYISIKSSLQPLRLSTEQDFL